jgi:hypothetical protein
MIIVFTYPSQETCCAYMYLIWYLRFCKYNEHYTIDDFRWGEYKDWSTHGTKFCYRLIRCAFTNYLRYTIKLIMADVGQIGVSGEQSQRCLVLIQIWFNVIIKQLMTFNFGEYKDAEVNIMFHGLINPCIHLIESHRLICPTSAIINLIVYRR